jgi:hypothetical protein
VPIVSVTEVIEVIGYQLWRRVLWRCSRHGVRSGRGRLQVLQMKLKSGGVPAVLSGVMVSMGRTLEKLGTTLYSP